MILYVPRSSETVERDFSISAGLPASTETPGKTAPLWSLTAPVNALCARVSGMSAVKYSNDTNTLMATRHVLVFILLFSSPAPSKHYSISRLVRFLLCGFINAAKGACISGEGGIPRQNW